VCKIDPRFLEDEKLSVEEVAELREILERKTQ